MSRSASDSPSKGHRCVAFDLGGTWFRSAIADSAGLESIRRVPALSFHVQPGRSVSELQGDMVDYLVAEVRERAAEVPERVGVISLGAALDGNTGIVYESGPLWGGGSERFDLAAALRERTPDWDWVVLNDVTAALLAYVAEQAPERRSDRMALVTVSTGIAARTFDFRHGGVPLDARTGLQGEIGHLVVGCEFRGRTLELPCDCGGTNHLNAFASGRGIEAVVAELIRRGEMPADAGEDIDTFRDAAAARAPGALEVLATTCRPLASVLCGMVTHDPELDPIVMTGGVASGFDGAWREVLMAELAASPPYLMDREDSELWSRRIAWPEGRDDLGLRGCTAALMLASRGECGGRP